MIQETIKTFFKGDVDDSLEVRTAHSTDASLFQIMPELVVYPKDADDVSRLVKWVSEEKKNNPELSIAARSAGTCMAGGSLNNSISLDGMRYLNALGEVKKVTPYKITPHFYGAHPVTVSGEVTVEPGVFYRDLEPKTRAQKLLLPCFTASKTINALGGMIGNNSGGELSLKYGKTQDYVKEVEVVFADGTREVVMEVPRRQAEARAQKGDFVGSIYKKTLELLDANKELIEQKRPHVSKNSAGYNLWNVVRHDEVSGEDMIDLSQLIVGSEGTLGITTSATMRLVEEPQHPSLLVVFISDLQDVAAIVAEALEVHPETIEAYDDKTIELAVRFWAGFIKKRGFWGALKLGLSFLPEFKMMLTGGVPKLVMLIECAGSDAKEVDARIGLLKKRLTKFSSVHTRVVQDPAAAEKFWIIRRDSFALLREHFHGKRTAPFVDDVIVPPASLPEFIPALREILERHKLTYNIHGHAGNGNFHIIPLIDADARLANDMILEVSNEVYALVLRLGGSITAEHNDGIIRTPFLEDMYGHEMVGLFAQIKNIFDPQNIFNPGKKVGLKKEDIVKYLISGK